MDNIIYEIVKYGHCVNLNDFNNTIDKINELIKSFKNNDNYIYDIVDYLDNLKNNYKQYINKIINKYITNPNNKFNEININIFDDYVYLTSFGIIVDDIILYDNYYISAYSILKTIEDKFDEDNLKIYTNNIEDYVACYLCLLNIIYNHGGGKNINDIMLDSYDNIYLNNAIYITRTNELYKNNHNIDIKNIFTLLQIDIANNTNISSHEIKQQILMKYLPIKFYNEFSTNNYIGILMIYSPTNNINRSFQIEEINDVLYKYNSDWSKQTQTITEDETINLLNNLYIYEENIRHVKQIMHIKNSNHEPWFNNNIDERFTHLNISKKLLSVNVKIGDVLSVFRSGGTNIDKRGSKYPYVSSIDTNNGIYYYVDKFDTIAGENNPIISIGMTHTGKGSAFVHTYNFAHSPNVVLFKMKTNNINVYNLSFSITEYLTKIKTSLPSYISAKFILSQYINVIASDNMI